MFVLTFFFFPCLLGLGRAQRNTMGDDAAKLNVKRTIFQTRTSVLQLYPLCGCS